jgi:hypothetical protein
MINGQWSIVNSGFRIPFGFAQGCVVKGSLRINLITYKLIHL